MKELTLTISSRDYTIKLDDEGFAEAFERDWQKFIDGKTIIGVKELLNAFIKKSYESYEQRCDAKKLIESVSITLKK